LHDPEPVLSKASRASRARTLIWLALLLQAIGLLIDGAWHGWLHPEFEPATRYEVLVHLATVHAVFLAGVIVLLVATAWTLVRSAGRSRVAATIALFGSGAQITGQAWDAWEHTRLSHGPPLAWTLVMLGPLIVLATLLVSRRRVVTRDDSRRSRQHPAV